MTIVGVLAAALCAVEELLVELGAARVVVRGDHGYWQGIRGERGHMQGHTDCVQEGAGPEEVLWRVDDGVTDRVEHLDGRVSPHGAWRGTRMKAMLLKNASSLGSLPQSFTMQPQWHAMSQVVRARDRGKGAHITFVRDIDIGAFFHEEPDALLVLGVPVRITTKAKDDGAKEAVLILDCEIEIGMCIRVG